jgi:hypothetical protein
MCLVFGDLHQRPRQAGTTALAYHIFGVAPRIRSPDLEGKHPTTQGLTFIWLCLALTPALLFELGLYSVRKPEIFDQATATSACIMFSC